MFFEKQYEKNVFTCLKLKLDNRLLLNAQVQPALPLDGSADNLRATQVCPLGLWRELWLSCLFHLRNKGAH
jgi:hypothetical protein